jgi:putative ABC transport system permease protein
MGLLSSIARDLRFALRQLRQAPIVNGLALLSLALGIGANVAIFSLVNALVLRPLPVQDPERLGRIVLPTSQGVQAQFSNPVWEYLRDHHDGFSAVAATSFARFNLNARGEMRVVPGLYMSGQYLEMMGVSPALGRGFSDADDQRGGGSSGSVAILSYGFWQREYGGDPSVLGRTLTLDGHPFTIVGVTPRDFFGVRVGLSFEVAVPLAAEAVIHGTESWLDRRNSANVTVLARLAPAQTFRDAEARLRAFQPQLRDATMPADYRPEDQGAYLTTPLTIEPASTGFSFLRDRYSRPLYVLLSIVALVLAIACVNMANLLLAQAAKRRRELIIRLSLGASRAQLVRQVLVESIMLSLLGAAAGIVIAAWGSRVLVAMIATPSSGVVLDPSIDWRVLSFTVGVGILTGLFFGVAPALRGTSLTPADALRDHARGITSGGGRLNFGHGLVAFQIALSFVLVFGSTLFVRTLVGLTAQPLGFESSRVLVGNIDLRRTGTLAKDRYAIFSQLRSAIADVPGVDAAAVAFLTPVSGSTWNETVVVRGDDGQEQRRSVSFNGFTQDYFRAMGTPVLAGRDFAESDTATTQPVVIVNEEFAKKFFAGQNPVGRFFAIDGGSRGNRGVEIVGLVGNAKYRTLREAPQPTIYGPMTQQQRFPPSSVRLVVRTAGAPLDARAAVVRAIAGVNEEIMVDLKRFDDDVDAATTQERLIASLSAAFGGLALVLAALGLYGVMSYAVTRRKSEIGIRMALGAEPANLVRLVLGQVAFITLIGLAVGAAASIGTGRFINTLLFNLAANDVTMIVVTAITLAMAAAVAGYLPARRAARIDPMVALRED